MNVSEFKTKEQIDLLMLIRNAESSGSDYGAIGSSINSRGVVKIGGKPILGGKKVPRGIALGIFQGLPQVWEYILNAMGLKITVDQAKLFASSKSATDQVKAISDNYEEEYMLEDALKNAESDVLQVFKNTWRTKIQKILPIPLQDKAQAFFLKEAVKDKSDDELIDWRSLLLYNHQGYLESNHSWANPNWIENNYLDKKHSVTPASYLYQCGILPTETRFIQVGELKEYLEDYRTNQTVTSYKYGAVDRKTINVGVPALTAKEILDYESEKPILKSNSIRKYEGETVLGDIRLHVPPSSIHVYQQSQIYNFEALRMAGSAKIVNNAPVVRLDMSFYINGSDRVNGDLRNLIAQYKQTPFTILRNETAYAALINEISKNDFRQLFGNEYKDNSFMPIPVILDSISLSSVPGFMDLFIARITLGLFNHFPYVKQLKFWNKSKDGVANAIFGLYKNSTEYHKVDIIPDQSVIIQDRDGQPFTINAKPYEGKTPVTDDPITSWPYKKTYGSIIENKEQPKYTVGYPNTLTTYDVKNHIKFEYYSTQYLNLSAIRFTSLLEDLKKTIEDVIDVGNLTKASGFEYLHDLPEINYSFAIDKIAEDLQNAIHLYSQVYEQSIKRVELYRTGEDIGPLINNSTYLRNLNGYGNDTPDAILKSLQEEWSKENGKPQPNPKKKKEIKKLFSLVAGRAFVALYTQHSKAKDQHNLRKQTLDLTKFIDSSISLSYRNKFTAMPLQGYTFPTYQHLGQGEWNISLNIKTKDETVITLFEDIQNSAAIIIRDQLSHKRGFEGVTHRLQLKTKKNILSAIGIRNVVMRGMNFSNIEGRPGWYDINIEFAQDDVDLGNFGNFELLTTAETSALEQIAQVFFPQNNKVLSAYEDQVRKDTGFNYEKNTLEETSQSNMLASNSLKHPIYTSYQKEHTKKYDEAASDITVNSFKVLFNQNQGHIPHRGDQILNFKRDSFTLTFYEDESETIVNETLTEYVYKTIVDPLNNLYDSTYKTLLDANVTINTTNQFYSIYERYLYLVGEYFTEWGNLDTELRLRYMSSDNKQDKSNELKFTASITKLFDSKRLSLAKLIIRLPILDILSGDGSKNDQIREAINKTNKVLTDISKRASASILNNYTDFKLPTVPTGIHNNNIMGPAFPYVDFSRDEVLKDKYIIGEDFVKSATAQMAAISGVESMSDLVKDKTDIDAFLKEFKNTTLNDKPFIQGNSINAIRTYTASNMLKFYEDYLETYTEAKKENRTVRLKLSKAQMLKMLKIRSILKWYSINKALSPQPGKIAARLRLTEEAKKKPIETLSAADFKIEYNSYNKKHKDAIPLADWFQNYAFKDVGEKNKMHNNEVRKHLKTISQSDQATFLDGIYEAYTDMVRTCNQEDADDPAITNFLGLSDYDINEQRSRLRKKLVNAKTNSYTGSMYRAFPTFKIFFMKEDDPDWMLFDDFYNYNALISVDIVDSKLAASQTAIIKLNNLTEKLTSNKGQGMLSAFDTPYNANTLLLRPGAPVMIKGGYGPDNSTLPVLFTGAVTQVVPGEIMELTCQSWGVELTNPVSTSKDGKNFTSISPERSMGAAIMSILSGTKGLSHFGRWSPGELKKHEMSYMDRERAYWASQIPTFDFILKPLLNSKDEKSLSSFLEGVAAQADNIENGLLNWGNPLYDNIYMTNVLEKDVSLVRIASKQAINYFSKKGSFVWKVNNESIWNVLNEMALFLGDYVVRALPYNEGNLALYANPRMTLYFGPREGYYQSHDDINIVRAEQQKVSPALVSAMIKSEQDDTLDKNFDIESFRSFVVDTIRALIDSNAEFSTDGWFKSIFRDQTGALETYVYSKLEAMGMIDTAKLMRSFFDTFHSVFYAYKAYPWYYRWLMSDTVGVVNPVRNPQKAIDDLESATRALEGFNVFSLSEFTTIKNDKLWDTPKASWDNYVPKDLKTKEIYKTHGGVVKLIGMLKSVDTALRNDAINILTNPKYENAQEGMRDQPTIRALMKDDPVYAKVLGGVRKFAGTKDYMYKPIVEHHFVNSYEHIIDNQIIATADSMFNKVDLTFPEESTNGGKREAESAGKVYSHSVKLNPYLDANYTRTYSSFQKNLRFDWLVDWMRGKSYSKETKYDSRNAMPLYSNIANQILMDVAKPMYQGNLTMIGNPSIKPWHILFMYDEVNQMFGPVEVEQVVHSFNLQSGYTTTIVPNAVIHNRDLNKTWDTQYMSYLNTIDTVNAIISSGKDVLTAAATGLGMYSLSKFFPNLISGAASIASNITKIGGLASKAIKYGPKAYIAYLLGKAALSYSEVKYVGSVARAGMINSWMPLTIVPLMYKGKPYMAGTEGSYWGDDIYTFVMGQLKKAGKDMDPTILMNILNPEETLTELN